MAEYEKTFGGVEEPDTPYDNFYSGVMDPISVVTNILRNVKDPNVSGITHKFDADKLILTVNVYEFPSDKILKDMVADANEVIKWLKKRYKEETGKTLKLKNVSDSYDVVGAYTTNRKAKIAYSIVFDMSGNPADGKTNSLDNTGVGLKKSADQKFKVA